MADFSENPRGGGILRQDGGRKWRPQVPFSRLLKGLGG